MYISSVYFRRVHEFETKHYPCSAGERDRESSEIIRITWTKKDEIFSINLFQ